jgi:hypothetical protein
VVQICSHLPQNYGGTKNSPRAFGGPDSKAGREGARREGARRLGGPPEALDSLPSLGIFKLASALLTESRNGGNVVHNRIF